MIIIIFNLIRFYLIFLKIIESFGDKKSDVAADSAEVQQLKGFLQERDREIERMEVR